MQSPFESALIPDYRMCMIWTLKKRETQGRCSPNSHLRASRGRSLPLPPATSFNEAKAKTQVAAAGGDSIREKA